MPSPDHAYPWAYFKALSHLVGALSPFLLGITFRSLLCAAPSTWFVLFQPWGLYRETWDSSFPCVWGYSHCHCYALWALQAHSCVLRLDPLTWARSVNGQDFCFCSFRPVWDLLSVHHRPQGLLITPINLSVLFMLYTSFLCWSSLFLPTVHCELWLFNHS